MTELDKRFEKFLDFVKDAPGYVKENLMCYYYHNTSACILCPKEDCKAREPRPIAEQTVDHSEIAEYVVRIDEFSLFAVPNPKVNFNLFEHVITHNAFTTRWEKILSQFIMDRLGPMNEELNALRNFTKSVSTRLEKAERTAREQDNHHYYKLFAEQVKALIEKL